MDETTFEVVIVGGGTAGCILAARLSEDPARSVLLLEAGPDVSGLAECPPSIRDEMGYPFEFMWNYDALPTEHDDHHTVAFRGRAMGGSGSVNGMIYARGDPEDYDSWGSALWTSAALRPSFERIETGSGLSRRGPPCRRPGAAEAPSARAVGAGGARLSSRRRRARPRGDSTICFQTTVTAPDPWPATARTGCG